jgi:hypothetical protein
MNQINIDEAEQKFLLELFEQTKGSSAAQVSMFTVGAALNMDKNASKRSAETLMSWDLIEIRTLSGGIAITAEGVEEARKLGAGAGSDSAGGITLGNAPVADEAVKAGIEKIVTLLKHQAGNLGLNFDDLSELLADLRTIDAQLTSPKPKTAILRESFRSLKNILEKSGAKESLAQVKGLLGE